MAEDRCDGSGARVDGGEAADSTARAAIRDYYDRLRDGDPLAPYFADEAGTVKFGVSEQLFGGDEVAAGLEAQTRTTAEWSVTSRRLTVTEDGDHAWFADLVNLSWTDAETGERRSFATRWSGSLRRRDGDWEFLGMHVSAPQDLDDGTSGDDGDR